MNEALVKSIIKYKLNAAEVIVDRLPLKISKELKAMGRIILESINESAQDINMHKCKKTEPSDGLNNVMIE